jgi:hypothetical protein
MIHKTNARWFRPEFEILLNFINLQGDDYCLSNRIVVCNLANSSQNIKILKELSMCLSN